MMRVKRVFVPTLAERIAELHKEIDEVIARHVEATMVPGVPRSIIEQLLWAKVAGGKCRCAAVRQIQENGSQT